MGLFRRIVSPTDRVVGRTLWVEVAILGIGLALFGGFYLADQRVSAGPSLSQRQVRAAEEQVRTAPNSIAARLELARAYQRDGRSDDALRQYQEILAADGTNRLALLGAGSIYLANHDLDRAAETYRAVVGTAGTGEFAGADPQLQEAHYYLGQIRLTQGELDDAATELQAALRIEPTDSDAWYLLGTARLKDGDAKAAAAALREAVRFVPTGWCEPYSALVQAYHQLGQAPQERYAGAMVAFCRHDPDAAVRELTPLTTGPVAVEAMLGLGMIAENGTDRDAARQWYRRVLAADPDNAAATSALARLDGGTTAHQGTG